MTIDKAVFNLEISQSVSYVPHFILNWVIIKIVSVKLSFFINFILHLTKLTNKILNKYKKRNKIYNIFY